MADMGGERFCKATVRERHALHMEHGAEWPCHNKRWLASRTVRPQKPRKVA